MDTKQVNHSWFLDNASILLDQEMYQIPSVQENPKLKKSVTPRDALCGPNGQSGLNAQRRVAEEGVKEVGNAQLQLLEMGGTFVMVVTTTKKKLAMKM